MHSLFLESELLKAGYEFLFIYLAFMRSQSQQHINPRMSERGAFLSPPTLSDLSVSSLSFLND